MENNINSNGPAPTPPSSSAPRSSGSGNSNGPSAAPTPMPKFETSRIPVRQPKKFWKIGGVLVLGGLVLLCAGWFNGARGGSVYFDRSGLHVDTAEDMEATGVNIRQKDMEPFERVEISAGVSDINFIEADSYSVHMVFPDGYEPEWGLAGGKLTVDAETDFSDRGFRINFFNMNFSESVINVYYPEDATFESIELSAGVGDIDAEIPSTGSVNLNTGTGDINAKFNGRAAAEVSTGVGEIILTNDGGEAIEADVETGTDDIEIYSGTWRNLHAGTGVGDIDIDAELIGQTELNTGTGSITVESSFEGDQGYDLSVVDFVGEIEINGDDLDDNNVTRNTGSDNVIQASAGVGDIELEIHD